jgi:hypothetical protein
MIWAASVYWTINRYSPESFAVLNEMYEVNKLLTRRGNSRIKSRGLSRFRNGRAASRQGAAPLHSLAYWSSATLNPPQEARRSDS